MALEYIKKVNDKVHLAVWKIEEDIEFYQNHIQLSKTDENILIETTHPEKRLEVVAGRRRGKTVVS